MIYVYPIEFESKAVNRKTLVVYTIVGILLFQFGMFTIAGSVLSKRVSIYLLVVLIIQTMIIFTLFEFIRKPWEGKETQIDNIIGQQVNNFFDDISSYKSGFEKTSLINKLDGSRDYDNEKLNKVEILKKYYQNPLEVLLLDHND
jgi:uncharacterized membrane protein YjdF